MTCWRMPHHAPPETLPQEVLHVLQDQGVSVIAFAEASLWVFQGEWLIWAIFMCLESVFLIGPDLAGSTKRKSVIRAWSLLHPFCTTVRS